MLYLKNIHAKEDEIDVIKRESLLLLFTMGVFILDTLQFYYFPF